MTRDYVHFIHRVRTDRADQDFNLVGDMWADLNPDWRVINWDLDHLDEEFPDLRQAAAIIGKDTARLARLYGVALVEHWGGIFVGGNEEPKASIDQPRTDAWITSNRQYFGSAEPGEPFWHSLLAKLTGQVYLDMLRSGEDVVAYHQNFGPEYVIELP
jgi:hypothetical protein